MNDKKANNYSDEDNPLVSFILLTYNQERFVHEAVEAAFAQNYSSLEIILSDDCSTDYTFNVMSNMVSRYTGKHKLILTQTKSNCGLAAHISRACSQASGRLIVVAAGDDVSFPNRVETLVSKWRELGYPSASIYSSFQAIDEDGAVINTARIEHDIDLRLSNRDPSCLHGVTGSTQAWTKDLFEKYGPYDNEILHEDVIIPLRALIEGYVSYVPDQLVRYRLTNGSLSRIDFNSNKDRQFKMLKYWRGRAKIYEQYDKDLVVAFNEGKISLSDKKWLIDALMEQRYIANAQVRFFSSSNKKKLVIAISSVGRVPIIQVIKWIIIALWPRLYDVKAKRGYNFD